MICGKFWSLKFCSRSFHNLALELKLAGHSVTVIDSLAVNNILSFTSNDIKNKNLYNSILNNRIEVNGKSLNQNLYKYNNEIRFFCKKKKIYLININNLAKKIKKNFCLPMPDGIHLNKKGVKFYSKNVFEHLIKIINEKKI